MGIRVCRPHLNSVIQFICHVSSKVVFLSKSHHFTDRLDSLAASSALLTLLPTHTYLYLPICCFRNPPHSSLRGMVHGQGHISPPRTHSQPPAVVSAQGQPQLWGRSPPIRASVPCPVCDALWTPSLLTSLATDLSSVPTRLGAPGGSKFLSGFYPQNLAECQSHNRHSDPYGMDFWFMSICFECSR